LTFNPDETSKQIVVPIIGDTTVEPDETFFVNLSNPSGATIADGQGLAIIQNDDSATLSIDDASIIEGDSPAKNATFTVTLSNPSSQAVTVQYTTSDDTAQATSDYTAGND